MEAFALARLCLLKREGVCAAVGLAAGSSPWGDRQGGEPSSSLAPLV